MLKEKKSVTRELRGDQSPCKERCEKGVGVGVWPVGLKEHSQLVEDTVQSKGSQTRLKFKGK